jgi:hypothetical protein
LSIRLSFLVFAVSGLLFASDPWNKNPQKWTAKDDERILTASPWAQETNASFGDEASNNEPPPPGPLPGAAQAGMAGGHAATDGRWDGGIGRMPRGGVPSLPVLIRWDSALPVREAASHVSPQEHGAAPQVSGLSEDLAAKDYVLTVTGLIPAKSYHDAGQLNAPSSSDGRVDARDPEEMLEGLMANSRFLLRGRSIAPENVKLDAATGTLRIFFPRSTPISARDREVVFTTHFGAIGVHKVFRLENMTYQGRLEL